MSSSTPGGVLSSGLMLTGGFGVCGCVVVHVGVLVMIVSDSCICVYSCVNVGVYATVNVCAYIYVCVPVA